MLGRGVLISLALGLTACFAAGPTITTSYIGVPQSIPFDASLRPNSTWLDLNDPSFTPADYNSSTTATQVHLSLAGPNAVFVMWATGAAQVGQGALTANDLTPSIVKYGAAADTLTMSTVGTAETYKQIYNFTVAATGGNTSLNYTSPVLHNVRLTGLQPATRYFYQVGDGTNFSGTFNFTSMQAPGPNYPQRIVAIADAGFSYNATSTLGHAVYSVGNSSSPPIITYVGDFTYADQWWTNGTASKPVTSYSGNPSGTYQPVWDSWQRMMQPLFAAAPSLVTVGNHEVEAQSDGNNTVFASVTARWKMPAESSGGSGVFWFSSDVGPVHMVQINPYTDYTPGSAQWNWLAQDLALVDRTVTPWIVLSCHNPYVGTTDSSFKQLEQMRASVEQLTYFYGVDLVFYGHVHSYERTAPMYNYQVDPCGTVYVTIGDAGNAGGVSGININTLGPNYEDTPRSGQCSNVSSAGRPTWFRPNDPTINDRWAYWKVAQTLGADGNSSNTNNASAPGGYCYAEQPVWSQCREPSFGHGTLDVLNSTHALWSWHRNQDGVALAQDQVYLTRQTSCANHYGRWPLSGNLNLLSGPMATGPEAMGAAAPAIAVLPQSMAMSSAAGRH